MLTVSLLSNYKTYFKGLRMWSLQYFPLATEGPWLWPLKKFPIFHKQ